MKLYPKLIIILLVFAIIARLVATICSFNFRQNTDVLRYRDWGRIAYLYDLSDTYKTDHLSFGTLPNNQPPGSLYIISAIYHVSITASKIIGKVTNSSPGSLQWVNGPLLDFFLRLPAMVADLLIGILIYILVRSKVSEKFALLSSSLFLFNPVVIYNSAFWGQMDSINNLLFLTAIYCLIKRKLEFVLPLVILSLFVKLSLLPIVPIFLLLILVRKQFKKFFLSGLLSIVMIFVLTLPVSSSPLDFVVSFFATNGIGEMQNITAFAFNYWWVIFKPTVLIGSPSSLFSFSEIRLIGSPLDNVSYFGFTLFHWSLALYSLLLVPLFMTAFRNREKILKAENVFLVLSLSALVIFLFLPRMHERYIYPVFPLLTAYYGLTKKSLFTFITLSLCSFINLYIVWHPLTFPLLSYDLIRNPDFQWLVSLIILSTSVVFYAGSLRILNNK